MKCPICGAESDVVGVVHKPEQHAVERSRVCDRGHKFKSVEVYPAQLADRRELECAIRNIDRRVARFNRDLSIAMDNRPVKIVAAEHGLTDARVRQIRASLPDRASHERFAKIASNLERVQS